jgi:hypothetical protein
VVDTPPQLGIRETRRITGPYQLSGEDVLTCASFSDTIGVNGWPIEAHKAGRVEWQWPPIPESRGFCQMPYRMILPQKVKNLLVAGRCASMTHEGQSAARGQRRLLRDGSGGGQRRASGARRQFRAG